MHIIAILFLFLTYLVLFYFYYLLFISKDFHNKSSDFQFLNTSKNSDLIEFHDSIDKIRLEFEREDEILCNYTAKLTLLQDITAEKFMDGTRLSFYWIDAWDIVNYLPEFVGAVMLIGKIRLCDLKNESNFFSCCCMIKDIPRIVYLLPVSNASLSIDQKFDRCYSEFYSFANSNKICDFSSKRVFKKLCFGPFSNNIEELEFLEITYSRKFKEIPPNLVKDSFICVSGSAVSALETLLLYCSIKGPCWLNIYDVIVESQDFPSWCPYNFSAIGLKSVNHNNDQLPLPLFTVMSICIKYIYSSNLNCHPEICILSYCIYDSFNIDDTSLISSRLKKVVNICSSSTIFVNSSTQSDILVWANVNSYTVFFHENEKSLITNFLKQIVCFDPDFIWGHDTLYWLDMIYHRALFHKVSNVSLLCRIKRINSIFSKFIRLPSGRIICDLSHSVKEMRRLESYDVSTLCFEFLHKLHNHFDHFEVKSMLMGSTNGAISCVQNSIEEAVLLFQIFNELSILQLAYQFTNLVGNTLSRTLLGGRAERNDFLLLHAFHCKNYLVPHTNLKDDRFSSKDFSERTNKKTSYAGGLVFEPKKGLYNDIILLLDFNSLYPSIIQEYNICFSTLKRVGTDYSNCAPVVDQPIGVIPNELEKLVKRRKAIKLMMKALNSNSLTYQKYDIQQKALKLTANSIYGCLGFSNSRFYAKSLASMITSLGRDILANTKEFTESQFGLEVIYGDTDSIMVNTHLEDLERALVLGNEIKHRVNELYKMIKIDIDSIFKPLLLLKKKKYAAISLIKQSNGEYAPVRELKGLDIVRRDWCNLAKVCGSDIIEILLSNCQDEIMPKLKKSLVDFSRQVNLNKYPNSDFIILKTLTKDPEHYKDFKLQPHVRVAKWLKQQGKRIAIGQVIPYVICNDGTNGSPLQRAYHPDRLNSNVPSSLNGERLTIDIKYYFLNQIIPVVSRICAPLVDLHFIDETLGNFNVQPSELQSLECVNLQSSQEYYVECKNCEYNIKILYSHLNQTYICPKCNFTYFSQGLSLYLYLKYRKLINLLYSRKFSCSESICSHQSKLFSDVFTDSHSLLCLFCCDGYLLARNSSSSLLDQLEYLNCFLSEFKDCLNFADSLNFIYESSGFGTLSLSEIFY